jgi:probable rRNA maturation factor
LSIRVYYDDIDFRLRGWKKIRKLAEKVIWNEKKIPGDLNFILTNDSKLKKMNLQFLKHNYYTDVISFNYGDGKIIEGEVYISIDTVKRNASNYKVSYYSELVRVIIHGILHLCGYDDKNSESRNVMRKIEDLWLRAFEEI